MAPPTTAEEWLPVLAEKLDKRAPRIGVNRSYCNGKAPLPEMGQNLRASWERFQKKARVNYGGLAVRSLKNRIRPRGVKVGDGTNRDLVAAAERIWRDNRLGRQFGQAILDRLQTDTGYLVVGQSTTDRTAVITAEKPEFFYAEADPIRPWKAVAALKVWRDTAAEKDRALVWVQGQRQKFVRTSKIAGQLRTRAQGDWELDGEPQEYSGPIPVIILARPDGQSLLEEHHDAIDAINLGKLNRLVVTAMQAFRQRALKKAKGGDDQDSVGGLPKQDDDGNDIDYAKVFEPAPGALWEIPEFIDIWESQETNIQGLLEAEKSDRRDFAAVTSTPISVLIPDSQNQSAEGAMNAKEGQVTLAEDEIDDLGPGLAMAIVYALQVEGLNLAESDTVTVDFAPPALVSLTEKYNAASLAKASGRSQRHILRDVLGLTPAEIRQEEADMAAEQLTQITLAAALAGGSTPGGAGGQQP